MKKLIFTILSIVSINSFGFDDSPYREFDTLKRERTSSQITWIVSNNVQKECNRQAKKYGAAPMRYESQACAIWFGPNNNQCIIVTSKKVSMHSLGHEILHCFFGHWH